MKPLYIAYLEYKINPTADESETKSKLNVTQKTIVKTTNRDGLIYVID